MHKGIFERMDKSLQKDLLRFVKDEEKRDGKTLGESISAAILRKLISGDCEMTGCCTDSVKEKMYVEYTFCGVKKNENREKKMKSC